MAAPKLPVALAELEGLERDIPVPGETNEAPRLCRIALSADAPEPIILRWHPGKGSGTRSKVTLRPGESIVEVLAKVEAWFGPFTTPERYANTTDERKRESLQKFWRDEKKRVLDRYDYPRIGGKDMIMTPTGPHRFPDVTVTVIEPDGDEHDPIRLHQLYRIGEFDSIAFAEVETAEDVRAEYEAKLAEKDAAHEATANDLRAQMAQQAAQLAALSGQLQGFMKGLQTQAPAATAPAEKAGK